MEAVAVFVAGVLASAVANGLVVVAPRRPAAVDVYSPVSTRVPGAMVVWIRGCILNVVLVQVQFFADLAVRQVQPLEIQTQDPGAQG